MVGNSDNQGPPGCYINILFEINKKDNEEGGTTLDWIKATETLHYARHTDNLSVASSEAQFRGTKERQPIVPNLIPLSLKSRAQQYPANSTRAAPK